MTRALTILSVLFLASAFLGRSVSAGDLVHQWRSPAFNGNGYSSHVLTIENLIHQRKAEIKAKKEAAEREAARDADNTNVNKFLRNFESRGYAELSKQLSEQLFGESASDSGTIEIMGNTIEYSSDGTNVSMTVTDAAGTTTALSVPLSGFGF